MESEALEQAQRTIARQEAEIKRLRGRLDDERFAEDLKSALSLASMTGAIASPVAYSRLLEMIVETAARFIPSEAASLFLIDQENYQLVFEVALGQKAQEVKKFTVPMGHGIAGLVAVSGQPMAVSDAQNDTRQASDIAQSINYAPRSILCVPLFYNDTVIGVLELLDKIGAAAYSADDIYLLGFFASQAAVAIEQSRVQRNLVSLVSEALASLGGVPEETIASLGQRVGGFSGHIEEDASYRQALDLARLVQQIAGHGEAELEACRKILQSFAEYLNSRPSEFGDL